MTGKRTLIFSCLVFLAAPGAIPAAHAAGMQQASGSFRISNIELKGLQRISPNTVFSYLPVHVGEVFNVRETPKVIQALYATGFFDQISLYRQGDLLIVELHERPAINDIKIRGNHLIKTKRLKQALQQAGIVKGQVYKPDVLAELKNQLLDQYYARGKYNVKVDVRIQRLPRNRVNIDIHIIEGKTATVKQVVIVGNQAYPENKLRGLLDIGPKPWWAFWSNRNQYSQARVAQAMNQLADFYLNHGYLNYALNSYQTALTPTHRQAYVTFNIQEGSQYKIGEVSLQGRLLYPRAELEKLLQVKPGQVFSRKNVIDSIKALQNRYGDDGYAFANINPIPQVDKATKTVNLTFFIDPGRRYYVREIRFFGNHATSGNVFRREMRQLEGALYSTKLIALSKQRLQRLPFVESVNIDTRRVPGTNNQVDLDVHLKDRLASSFSASIGYSQFEGVIFSTGVTSSNFMGTGNAASVNINTSKINTLYSLNYTNPYYTINGVSRTISLYYQRTNTSKVDIVNYSANRLGLSMSYGIPLTEYDTLNAGFGFQDLKVTEGSTPSQTVSTFIAQHGTRYKLFNLSAGITHDTRNRTIFPTSGNYQGLNLFLVTPGSTVKYYKLGYFNQEYVPLTRSLTAKFSGSIDYGSGYGGISSLPFFDRYYAGGMTSVAGFKTSTLGPLDPLTGQPVGGDFKTIARASLLFPVPFLGHANSIRMSAFVDTGNVFASYHDFKASALRSSAGIALEWLSPIGPLSFSLAKPFNVKPTDQTQVFQFNIGTYF